jgi:hypothetical protein
MRVCLWWKALNLAILLLSAYFDHGQSQDYWRRPPTQVLDVKDGGLWRLALAHAGLQAGETIAVFLHFECEGCYEQLQYAHLAWGDGVGLTSESMRFSGNRAAFRAVLKPR